MKSIYLTRGHSLYPSYKKAVNTIYRQGDSAEGFSQRFYQQTGCRVVKRTMDEQGYFLTAIIEFEQDKDYTMFMLRWS